MTFIRLYLCEYYRYNNFTHIVRYIAGEISYILVQAITLLLEYWAIIRCLNEGVKIAVGIYSLVGIYIMSGFRHEFQSLTLIRNLTTYTPNVDVLKACENAYILVEFTFRLVENSPRKRSQQTVVDHATEIQKL
jgi:hypothetical protein